jgi:hypothetical protein
LSSPAVKIYIRYKRGDNIHIKYKTMEAAKETKDEENII